MGKIVRADYEVSRMGSAQATARLAIDYALILDRGLPTHPAQKPNGPVETSAFLSSSPAMMTRPGPAGESNPEGGRELRLHGIEGPPDR